MKDNFCIVPWIHLMTNPNGKTQPCCAFFDDKIHWPKIQQMPLEEIWNCKQQKDLRSQFLSNQPPKGCDTCFKREDSGSHSMRLAMNERFDYHIAHAKNNTASDGHYDKFNLIYWDFRLSNICNFKCRMCGHGLSSSWYDELSISNKKDLPKILDANYYGNDLMKYVDQFIDTVEEIYFAGGEPLIMVEHYQILEKLIEKNRYDVFLRYNTNMSTLKYKDYDLIEIWKKFRKVDIFASIDGIEENAEYTRSGTDWKRVENNLEKLVEVSNIIDPTSSINLLISSTVHIYNVFHFPKLVDKMIDMGIDPGRLVISNLLWPNFLKTAIMPDDLKQQLKDTFYVHASSISNSRYKKIVEEKYQSILYFLDQSYTEKDIRDFVKETLERDKFRKESIHEAVPELSAWFSSIK
jgi:radical SAM protein with 4Fe4S-binding SPASM domain